MSAHKMKAWEEFLQSQEKAIGSDAIERWAKTLKVVRFDARNLYLEVQDSFQLHWFEEHLRPKVNKFFKNGNEKAVKVHLILPNAPKIKGKVWNPTLDLNSDPLNSSFQFDSFFPGSTNQINFQVLRETISNGSFNPLYIQGGRGTGKTHLLMASMSYLSEKRKKCLYVKAATLTHHVVTAIRSGQMQKLRNWYRQHEVLVIDEVQELAYRNATQEELFHTFNALYASGGLVILASTLFPYQLKGIEPRLTSRFEWGLVLSFRILNLEEKVDLLSHFTTLSIQDSSRLAAQFTTVSHLLEAANALTKENGSQQTVLYLLSKEKKIALSPDKVISVIAQILQISPSDLVGRSQSRCCSFARQMAIYWLRIKLNLSFFKIGKIVDRNHSTVMTAVKNIEKKISAKEQHCILLMQRIEAELR